MVERAVKVRLSAQVQEYISGMEEAAKKTREVGSEGEKLAQQRANFQALGGAMIAVGGATTAMYTAALKTGIAYNTLQQTSRAALKTMLGSTEAVNEQMDKLDAFAKTSPFAKSTFIEAQQQMLAFGIETKKVIPYLDAVQNAVAAAGGSNQQIAELAFIMAQIKSAAKITAQDLMQFGQRGVNAAELIGASMGKTGAQIRAEITAGTLDADKALDALAEGMSTKFAGASANVKETFAGAMDRVKAAWRDFGAELARPLVDPEGGGALVDFLNGLADAMRGFEKLPEPLKDSITALTGLGGAALLAGGMMLLAIPKWVEFKASLDALNISGGQVAGTFGTIGLVVAGLHLSAQLQDWVDDIRGVTVASDDLLSAIRENGSAIDELQYGLTGGNPLRGLGFDAELAQGYLFNLNTTVGQMTATFEQSWLGKGFTGIASLGMGGQFGKVKTQIEELDVALSHLVSTNQTAAAAKAFGEFSALAEKAGWSVEDIEKALPKYAAAQKDAAASAEAHNSALESMQGKAVETEQAVDGLAAAIRGFGSANLDTRDANRQLEESFYKLSGAVEANGYTLDISTEAGRENEAAIDAVAQKAFIAAAAVYEQTGSQEKANQVLAEGRERLLAMIEPFVGSRVAAEQYVNQLGLVPENIDTFVRLQGVADAESQLMSLTLAREVVLGVKQAWHAPLLPDLGSANGNMFEYANGGLNDYGLVQAFANGGIPAGIYSGGPPLYKWAEPETRWEAFISGKPGQEARNREIWVEAGDRLGMGERIARAVAGALSQSSSSSVVNNNLTVVNPVVRDLFDDAWEGAQEKAGGW